MKLTMAAAAVAAVIAAPALAAPINPLAVYTFDNGLTTDDSGNGNTGTIVAGASLAAGAGIGGSDALALAAVAGLSGINTGIDINRSAIPALTMGAWVNPSDITSNPGAKILSHDNGGFDRTLGVDSRGNTAGKDWAAFTGNGVADASGGVLLNTWTHLAVVYDGVSSKLFVNGSLAETFTEATGLNDSGFNLFIGTNPGFNEDFAGLLDDVFVYDRALGDSDIVDIYRNGFAAPPAVPLPAGMPLLLAGLGGLAALRRISRKG